MNDKIISKDQLTGRFNENAMKQDNNFIWRMCKNRDYSIRLLFIPLLFNINVNN